MRYVKHTETSRRKAKTNSERKNVVIETRYGQEKIGLDHGLDYLHAR